MALPGLHCALAVELPDGTDPLVRRLLHAEIDELTTALGVPVELVDGPAPPGPRWVVVDDGSDGDGSGGGGTGGGGSDIAELSWDPDRQLLRTRGPLLDGMQLLHALVRRGGGTVTAAPARTPDEVAARVVDEVGGSYPAFALRGLDWAEVCARHSAAVASATGSAQLSALQRWIAELADVHTAIRPLGPRHHPPYAARAGADGRVVLARVPPDTAAHRAGVRPGWQLDDPEPDLLARTGAPRHALALLAGRRALEQRTPDQERSATAPDGRRARWTETVATLTADTSVAVDRLDADTALLRLRGFLPGTDDVVATALAELRGHRRLVLDLRGNTGGMLVEATAVRNRLLRAPTPLGSITYTDGAGRLGPRLPLVGQPHAEHWTGEVVAVTDGLTASASEDLLLGLQGLAHVRVVGAPSAGGSGRARAVRLTEDLLLSISTALTHDRDGHCVENAGIPVDHPTDPFADDVLDLAGRL